MPVKMIDETGNKYGSLTVIEYALDKDGRGAWLCQCDCGNTKIVRGPDLRKNKITHCSKTCPCKIANNFIDETGNRYGFLTVLNRAENSEAGRTKWHCKCDCGNECDILAESLRKGLTKSCGCKSIELNAEVHSKDLTGQQFGLLIAIERLKESTPSGFLWRCKCLCGCGREDVIVPTHRLLSHNTQSCGSSRKSHGEITIENFLKQHNINYQMEYSFDDLCSDSGKKLRFDFAIFKNDKLCSLIEFDGLQHFQSIDYFGGEEKFEKQIQYDNLKNLYCQKKNIPLLRIKYDDDIENKLIKFFKE